MYTTAGQTYLRKLTDQVTPVAAFSDREGNVWFASTAGLDRFRELPVTNISKKRLSSDNFTGDRGQRQERLDRYIRRFDREGRAIYHLP
jgi:hypothetical protein